MSEKCPNASNRGLAGICTVGPMYCQGCVESAKRVADGMIAHRDEKLKAANLQLRAMVEERDLYRDVVDAAESWLKHHGNGGLGEAEANKALRYQVERLGEKVSSKKRNESPWKCAHCGSRRMSTVLHEGMSHCLDCCNNTKI